MFSVKAWYKTICSFGDLSYGLMVYNSWLVNCSQSGIMQYYEKAIWFSDVSFRKYDSCPKMFLSLILLFIVK